MSALPAVAGVICLTVAWSGAGRPAAGHTRTVAAPGPSPSPSAGRPTPSPAGPAAATVLPGAAPTGSAARPATTAHTGPPAAGHDAAAAPAVTRQPARVVAVPAAVGAAAQAQSAAHWSPAAMTGAAPADQALAPRPPTGTAATTSSSGAAPAGVRTSGTLASTQTAAPGSATSATQGATVTATTPAGAGATITSTTVPATTAPPAPTVPADPGSPWTQGGQVTRTTGRVFFSLGGADYSCSGSAVDSPDASTVVTAAHCVEGDAGFATRWVFVPGYDRGAAPYGIFAANHLAVLSGFAQGDIGQDVALVNVGRNAAGQLLTAAVGGQPLSFDPVPGGVRAFGYPQGAPYDGSRLIQCGGSTAADPRPSDDIGMTCGMTGGSSGGPWLAGFDPATGRGRVVSVTSFSYADTPGVLFGPRLGPEALQLYTAVASDPAA